MTTSTTRDYFVAQLGLHPGQAEHLIILINKAARIQTDWHNGDATDVQADTAVEAVNKYAKQHKIRVSWPGLYPVFKTSDGTEVHLPD